MTAMLTKMSHPIMAELDKWWSHVPLLIVWLVIAIYVIERS